MVCKNCAAMQHTRSSLSKSLNLLPLVAAVACLVALPAGAEKADRDKPLVWTSDNGFEGSLDSGEGTLIGNVVISQGTMRLTADRVDVKQPADGFHRFNAASTGSKQVEFRQARDKPGETIVGLADRIEYDTKADTVRLIGHAVMRLLRGGLVASEAAADTLVFDKRTETYKAENQLGNRARFFKLPDSAGVAAPAAPASSVPLQPSTTIQPPAPRKGT